MKDDINYTGFIVDKVDNRDYILEEKLYGYSTISEDVVFEEIDLCLDECMPETYDSQGSINACVPYSWTKTMELYVSRVFKKKYRTNGFRFNNVLSKKFLYYTTRYITNGDISDSEVTDNGTSFRFTAKTLMQHGICIQKLHPETSLVNAQPSYDSLLNANLYRINAYYTVTTLQGILSSLKLGLPVQIGVDFDQISDAKATGYSAKSELWNDSTIFNPNHGMVIVGSTFKNGSWKFKIGNSHGKTWGLGGFCYIDAQRMWKYNIAQAMVFVMDTLVSDLDIENPNYIKTQELPNNSIIIGNFGFELNYSNNNKNVREIQEKIVLANNNIFIKTVSGELINNITGAKVTLNEMISVIGSIIEFKDKNGVTSNIVLKI